MSLAAYAPERFASAQLAAADFDNTVAETFKPPASGIGVHEAYESSIESLYGAGTLDRYKQTGGLHNRASAEVIAGLFPDMNSDEIILNSSRLDKAKLDILLEQIDGQWPEPTRGFVDFWERINSAQNEGHSLDTAVISAGHTNFIEKTFDSWGLPQPNVLITTETINSLEELPPPEERQKPAPLSMRLSLEQWVGLHGLQVTQELIEDGARRTIYAGDDPYKDGKLAEQFDIPFVLLTPDTAKEGWEDFGVRLGLGALSLKEAVVREI